MLEHVLVGTDEAGRYCLFSKSKSKEPPAGSSGSSERDRSSKPKEGGSAVLQRKLVPMRINPRRWNRPWDDLYQ